MIYDTEKMKNIHSDIRGPLFYEANALEGRGRKILKLNTGNPASFGFTMPDGIRSVLREKIDTALGYCDFRGMPEAREAILTYHKSKGICNINSEDIFIGNGVSEVVSFALTALLETGDEVLVPSPCYSLWSNSVYLCGAKPIFYTCDEASEWFPDCKDIEAKITTKTRAIVIINPNNPTGALYPKEILEKIADIARKRGLIIFSDEIYDRLIFDGLSHTSIASLAPDITVVTMNGLSKSHCLCGFRSGWMVISGPRNISEIYRQNLVKLTSMRLCANALSQTVIPTALSDTETPFSMVSPNGRLFKQREICVSELQKTDTVSFVKNKAAFYLFPRLDTKRLNITDDKKFARDLLYGTDILIVPASGFEFRTPDHFRIVMLPKAEVLKDAMRRLVEFLEGYKQK